MCYGRDRLEGIFFYPGKEADTMDAVKVAEHARALLDAYGDKAEAHAAQKASELRSAGETAHAEQWTRVRSMISEMRGSHVS
jgi:hypothetical protein